MRLGQCKASKGFVEVRAANPEFARIAIDHELDFGTLVRKPGKDRRRQSRSRLKSFRSDDRLAALLGLYLFSERGSFFVRFWEARVENDGYAPFIFIGIFYDCQGLRSRRCFPVDPAKLVMRLVFAKRDQVAPRAAPSGRIIARVHRVVFKFDVNDFNFWEYDQLGRSSGQPTSVAEKAERKFGRKLKILYQKPPTVWENVLGFGLIG